MNANVENEVFLDGPTWTLNRKNRFFLLTFPEKGSGLENALVTDDGRTVGERNKAHIHARLDDFIKEMEATHG